MAFTHGKNGSLIIGTFDFSPFLDKITPDITKDLAETTTFSTSSQVYKTRITGATDGKLAASGYLDTGAEAQADAQLSAGTATVTIASGVGQGVGNRCSLYQWTQSAYKTDASVGSAVAWSFDGVQSGGVDRGMYLHTTLAPETAAPPINGATVDWGALSTTSNGFAANLCVTAFAGTSCIIKVQDSADNVTFADLTGGTFTSVTAPTSQQLASTSQAVRRYTRAQVTSGTFTSVTFALALAKRS